MEDIAFSDWPGQPVDLSSGNNPWLPAYGFQTPSALLEREDFIGNPDADYFLQGGLGHYMYLETIQEETSDDLRSESDFGSRGSPVGWLATDSESGSVICIENTDDLDCDSDRELACPAKRRKQENTLSLPSDDDAQSISRSSSLLQFETLEKECQETCSNSPSICSQFSFDSLEANRKNNVSPDSLGDAKSDVEEEEEVDFYKTLKIDIPRKKNNSSRDSLLYNTTRYSGSESSDTGDSEDTLEASRSFDNLKTWRSFDSLPLNSTNNNNNKSIKDKLSAENLSEDSGYSDHLCHKSSSVSNLQKQDKTGMKNLDKPSSKNSYVGFTAYDGDVFQNFNGNFGVSYQDLSAFDKYDEYPSPLIQRFMKNRQRTATVTKRVNLEKSSVCERRAKYNNASSSEPNLPVAVGSATNNLVDNASSVCVSSVPKDLNLIGDFECSNDAGKNSIALKNWNLTDLATETFDDMTTKSEKMGSFKREGSYAEAMSNRVDLSDDEHSLCYKKKPVKSGRGTKIEEFDRKVLKAISETSIQSLINSTTTLADIYLNDIYSSTPISNNKKRRSVASTPNLAITATNQFLDDERRHSTQDITRKGSIIKSSTSTSGMSECEEKTLTASSAKSFTDSINSKGVHFSPVISEVNWRDDSVSTATPERESSYSLCSTPDREPSPPTPKLIKPQPRFPSPPPRRRLSHSQPDLSDSENHKKEFVKSLKSLAQDDRSKSQPDVNRFKRRGSQLVKKDRDGSTISAYVDGDGIQYQHTHLEITLQAAGTPSTITSAFTPQSAGASGGRSAAEPAKPKPVVRAMEVQDARRGSKDGKARAGKLGGFFQRLASFRFSARKGAEEKAKLKKKHEGKNSADLLAPQQRVATKEDYIYIPLKGPSKTTRSNHNNNSISSPPSHQQSIVPNAQMPTSKPPLPKQPPRVVHASVKKDMHDADVISEQRPQRRRRTTIDSGAAARRQPMEQEPMGLIETDLDTEVTVITSGAAAAHAKTRSLLNLGGADPRGGGLATRHSSDSRGHPRPHKSMEFLLDKENLKVVEPPENELQKGERVMSEHQLRVQRSLQKLTVPEWYKHNQVPREGFLLKKTSPREARWSGTGSKTTSLSSLGSSTHSPVILSPTPTNQPFVRWSTSKLNSTASSPCASTRSSFNARQPNGSISPSSVRSSFSYRQPYMGWRSQERLTRPRTPAERLANSILNHHSTPPPQPQESPEIQTSIKEVTSAIVHYVSGLKPEDNVRLYDNQDSASQRSSSVSPRGSQKLCWLESSFVGTRPLDSPQTPVTLSESQSATPVPPSSLRLDLQAHNDVTLLSTTGTGAKPSPGSTTLEDVLDSLLGLPSTGRAPSPSLQETVSANTSPQHLGKHTTPSEQFRRRSEGSEPSTNPQPQARRVSFTSSPILRCRNTTCSRTALANSTEAAAFKNCHNCSYIYCSKPCRRAHWEKHRKTCLFSRIGTLCRRVIAAAKEQKDTLLHISTVARRGYLSHGPGAVKCFFACPEKADKFLLDGLQSLGELTYVRWQDLLPSEMGPHLYAELVKMCKTYNPDTKLVLYVAVYVVSETPASGAVKWERQLASRCAKMRLSKDVPIPERDQENPETLILTCNPIRGNENQVRHFRERSVNNLQRHLRQRGVSIRRQHPDIHKQLNDFCEGTCDKFTPVTVYPTDSVTGKSFMCIIMLEADTESLRQVETAGVRVRTVDVLNNPLLD